MTSGSIISIATTRLRPLQERYFLYNTTNGWDNTSISSLTTTNCVFVLMIPEMGSGIFAGSKT